MANVDLLAKFGENRPKSGWDTPVYVFPRWRPSAILELSFPILDLSGRHPWRAAFSLSARNYLVWPGWDIAIL